MTIWDLDKLSKEDLAEHWKELCDQYYAELFIEE